MFQHGTKYDVANGLLWHRDVCGRDFNTPEGKARRYTPECRFRDTWIRAEQIVMMRALPRDRAKASSYQRKLSITDDQLVRTPSAGKLAV